MNHANTAPAKSRSSLEPSRSEPVRAPGRNLLRRPQSSTFPHQVSELDYSKFTNGVIDGKDGWKVSGFGKNQESAEHQRPYELELNGNEIGSVRPSWLRRMSTLSLSQHGSPNSTPRPSTPSISFSNSSSAPMLLSTNTMTLPTVPRNKLVKRSSSQRALQSGYLNNPQVSRSQIHTFRRPATSHQRSANFQQQYMHSDSSKSKDSPVMHGDEFKIEEIQWVDESPQKWYPFFQSHHSRSLRDTPSKKRDLIGANSNDEPIKCVSADQGNLPTLLMATSIYAKPSQAFVSDEATNNRNPFTPVRKLAQNSPSTTSNSRSGSLVDEGQKSRNSFSISDLFASPSPSAWKIARTGSTRRKKGPEDAISGRRVVSEPQSSTGRRNAGRIKKSPTKSSTVRPLGPTAQNDNVHFEKSIVRSMSSPLPPLDQFSAFKVDLPDTTPSSPISPILNTTSPSNLRKTSIPLSISNSSIQYMSKGKQHHPSGVSSDRASTIGGSDNDNSRLFWGDGDEVDYQSETVYDSIRTGATGSSHSAAKGPRIDTFFDSSPPSELLKQNLVSLQDKLLAGSFGYSNAQNNFIAEEEESIHTPINDNHPTENGLSTEYGHVNKTSYWPRMSSSPPPIPSPENSKSEDGSPFGNSHFDEDWNPEELELDTWNDEGLGVTGIQQRKSQEIPSPSLPHRRESRPVSQRSRLQEVVNFQDQPKSNIFEWSERNHVDRESQQGSSPRPKTVHGKQSGERGSRSTGRRAPSALHLRSQSVPLPPDGLPHRGVNSTSKLDAWLLGSKGVSEEWDGDFEFDEPVKSINHESKGRKDERLEDPTVITVPQAILERQASVHGQFGQVKELTLLVEELKRLRHQANAQGIIGGQSAELWKEAEGIINLATLDDEDHDWLVPRSPHSPGFDFDPFEEDSPGNHRRQRSGLSPPKDSLPTKNDHTTVVAQISLQSSPAGSKLGTPPHGRPRKESVARAKSVLEHIHQHRNNLDPSFAEVKTTHKKLPFDTTSLRDLVTRAGVVTRALKEIVRKANTEPLTPERHSATPPDPPFSHMFHPPTNPASTNRSPRGGNSASSTSYLGGSITGNDNEINGHMKMMTVV